MPTRRYFPKESLHDALRAVVPERRYLEDATPDGAANSILRGIPRTIGKDTLPCPRDWRQRQA